MPTLESEDYVWEKFDQDTYTVSDNKRRVNFKGDPTKQYYPVIADKGFSEGKHYWRVQTPCDNMRVGLATKDCPVDQEIGQNEHSWCVDLQTGDVWHNAGDTRAHSIYVPAPEAVARLYKIVVPISGGTVGLKMDMDEGLVQLFFNTEYMGPLIKDPKLKEKGPLYPCVAIGGLEGKVATSPSDTCTVPQMYSYKRNKL
eukprot:NODE_1887_length_819_cov_224.157143_g1488_i0.p1 GENE.NODE_1887_length_819_cov_224.157143_g1488_i0~~NODE_1887_length_819_cov_224.157143_g1488_i0.p1  ORF type:complete len:220 (-),score=57.70 NODE_1887_length_819_cov_224.157143_g1488_i0:160-756(-)